MTVNTLNQQLQRTEAVKDQAAPIPVQFPCGTGLYCCCHCFFVLCFQVKVARAAASLVNNIGFTNDVSMECCLVATLMCCAAMLGR
jgi:hypothetical protein